MAGLHQFKTGTDYGSEEEICILHYSYKPGSRMCAERERLKKIWVNYDSKQGI